jgi:hypothetical protein
MKVSHRLYVTVAPAVLGVFAIAALAYWGQRERQAPGLLVGIAIVAAAVSLVVAWSNARFIARRIEQLAGATTSATAHEDASEPDPTAQHQRASSAGGALRGMVSAVAPHATRAPDEIDAIAHAVDRLSRAANIAESGRAEGERRLSERARDHARLLTSVVDDATRRLVEARLPLHILLDNRFGDLNENQEEMLGDVRSALEAIDTELAGLKKIAEFDLGAREMRAERVRPSDLLDAIRPLLVAAAESSGAALRFDVAPLLPPIAADRPQLQEALTTLFRPAIAGAARGSHVTLSAQSVGTDASGSPRKASAIEIVLRGGIEPPRTIHTALSTRVVLAHGGSVEKQRGAVHVTLPAIA